MRTKAEVCATMGEVRDGIDALDRELVALLDERLAYMRAAARIKPARNAVRDETRKADVIAKAEAAARMRGMPAGFVATLYEQLVEQCIAYELEVFDAGAGA